MPVNFFKTELRKIQDRFNQTFGEMVVCNIKTRQMTILAIVGMGRLERRITEAKTKDQVRGDIKKFMRTNKTLTRLFDDIERSNHVERTDKREAIANSKAV